MNSSERSQRDALIKDAYDHGERIANIASATSTSEAVVYSIIRSGRKDGTVTRTSRSAYLADPEKVAKRQKRNAAVVEMYESGMTLAEIGSSLGISGEAVRKIIRNSAGLSDEMKTASYYKERRYERFVNEYGEKVDALFDEKRNMAEVIASFPELKATDVKRFLKAKSKSVVQTRTSRMHWTKERIISVLKDAADERDRLSTVDYDKWRNSGALFEGRIPPTKLVICWRFDTWNNAIEAAGLDPISSKRRVYSRSWNRSDAITAVRTYASESLDMGKRPTSAGYEKWSPSKSGVPCRATLAYASGGMKWSEMLREAFDGIEENQ